MIRYSYSLSQRAFRSGLQLGVFDDNGVREVNRIIKRTTPVTHQRGNKRFNDLILKVEGEVVTDIYMVKCRYCMDTKRVSVANECDKCAGRGCNKCRQEGYIRGYIPCQDCK